MERNNRTPDIIQEEKKKIIFHPRKKKITYLTQGIKEWYISFKNE